MSEKRLIEIHQKLNMIPNKNGRIYTKEALDHAVQDYVKKMRGLNEAMNKKTVYDQPREEEKFRKNFDDLNVTVEFIPLEVYDNFVFWGGVIDGIVQFAYKVTPDEKTSKVDFNYLEDFSVDNPDNDEIVKRVENYYDQFYQYWRDNVFQS